MARRHTAWRVGAPLAFIVASGLGFASGVALASSVESPVWSSYLDQAYVFAYASPHELRKRLDTYGEEAGVSLERYAHAYFETAALVQGDLSDNTLRRRAIAHLLLWLAHGDVAELEGSVEAARALENRLGRFENRYWYHYVLAHAAAHAGDDGEFAKHVLAAWLRVVVPLEPTHERIRSLALEDDARAGFAGALPFVYENLAHLVLDTSQSAPVPVDVDALGAVVRLLSEDRAGAHPGVVPHSASSLARLRDTVRSLDGSNSDYGSLTFVLALAEAGRVQRAARTLLRREGLSSRTVRAVRSTTAAYDRVRSGSETLAGRATVAIRQLRVLRTVATVALDTHVEVEHAVRASVEPALGVYRELRGGLEGGWSPLGFDPDDRAAYFGTLREFWKEIQETSSTLGSYYLARSLDAPERAADLVASAVTVHERYLALFEATVAEERPEALPDSAYFAAFEAARGIGDATLGIALQPRPEEARIGLAHYRAALAIFPFDRGDWADITRALTRHGFEDRFLDVVGPAADRVIASRAVDGWIRGRAPEAARIASVRAAVSDALALTYMGYADESGAARHDAELGELRQRRDTLRLRVARLVEQRDKIRGAGDPVPAAIDVRVETPAARATGLSEVANELAIASDRLHRLDALVEARAHALPLFADTLSTEGLARELRNNPDHPLHRLIRTLYHESRPIPRGAVHGR